MATEQKTDVPAVEQNEKPDVSGGHVKSFIGSPEFQEAMIKEPPKLLAKHHIKMYGICLIAFLCSTMNGYDGSLFSSISVMKPFQNTFGTTVVGAKLGLVTAGYTIGGACALPFIAFFMDLGGRRASMFSGGIISILGTIVEGTTATNSSFGQFFGGRFLLGFGVSLMTSASPAYVTEIATPPYRGVITGCYNCLYYGGSITATVVCRITVSDTTNQSWLIPTWIQMVAPATISMCVLFFPESPRWLFAHGKKEQARAILTRLHGGGNPDSLWVDLQMREFEMQISERGDDRRPWDFRALFNSRPMRYRTFCNFAVSVFGQMSGNGVVGYFSAGTLSTAGVTNPTEVLNINLGSAFVSAVGAFFGASQVERIGRRPMLMITCAAMTLVFMAMTICTALYSEFGNAQAALGSVAFLIIFGFAYSFALTPLAALYPVEVMSYSTRAKGQAFSSFTINVVLLLNQFLFPIALQNIGWKTFLVFVIWDAVQGLITWAFLVETKGRSLEELELLFNEPNPRNASIMRHRIVVDDAHNVKALADNDV